MTVRLCWLALASGALASFIACSNSSSESSTSQLADTSTTTASTTTESDADSGSGSEETETGTDELPPAPTLVSPSDGATELPISQSLCWTPVEDPEGEPLRYRVFIDDTQLTQGILEGEEGYEGPCAGPLLFAYERAYSWRVEAFEVDDPTRSSPSSETWTFQTIGDGVSERVFEDDFEADLGWTLDGDAGDGAWIRGDPQSTFDGPALAQPSACTGGSSCYFTGQNPRGLAEDADVDGGSTRLTSPAFDLGGAAAASVRLSRFFYTSSPMMGPSFRVELLVPNDAAPDGYDAFVLEQLETTANAWEPREYAACGLPMLDGSRLRVTASDPGDAIVEAAIDSVSVHAHDDPSLCGSDVGGACDPSAPTPCPGELLCCSQGAINVGVHRCEEPVAGLDYDDPTASPDDPGNGPLGCDAGDLIIDPEPIAPIFTDIFIDQATCELLEGCVGTTGWRSVMLFSLVTPNVGSADIALGVPANLPDLFHYSECHDHYHFDEFARYELRDGGATVATGHKQAFCLLDQLSWAWPFELPKFDCANQGVSRGFTDVYEAGLPCQWVDVTGVAPGDYTLHLELNQARPEHAISMLNERDYTNNTLDVPVTIP